jgi:F0F1-type ATP synthase epsilon subunit
MRAEILQTRARLAFLSGGVFAIKKIKLRSLLEEAIEKAKDINHEKVEREIEKESDQIAKKRFEGCSR